MTISEKRLHLSQPLCAAFSVLNKYSTKCQSYHFYPFGVV